MAEVDLASGGDQVAILVSKLLEALPPSQLIHLKVQDDEVAIPLEGEWDFPVEQGVQVLSTWLHLGGLALQGLTDRLSRG